MNNVMVQVVVFFIQFSARLITGVRNIWGGCQPEFKQRVYFANHSSHIDFILLWSSLPPQLRRMTRPVAASDYWLSSTIRRFLIHRIFAGIIIDRKKQDSKDPLEPVYMALQQGYSLIFFPEGTRNLQDDVPLQPFKSGLFHIAMRFTEIEFVPVWISNLNRVMPKGSFLPLPLLCTLHFGKPIVFSATQSKCEFLGNAQQALLKLHELEEVI